MLLCKGGIKHKQTCRDDKKNRKERHTTHIQQSQEQEKQNICLQSQSDDVIETKREDTHTHRHTLAHSTQRTCKPDFRDEIQLHGHPRQRTRHVVRQRMHGEPPLERCSRIDSTESSPACGRACKPRVKLSPRETYSLQLYP